jgi:hypothetical protein
MLQGPLAAPGQAMSPSTHDIDSSSIFSDRASAVSGSIREYLGTIRRKTWDRILWCSALFLFAQISEF